MSKHARFSASASARWLECPASVRLTEDFENKSSVYGEEGTAAHDLAEYCLRKEVDAEELIGQTFNKHVVDSSMASYVQQYVDFVRAIKDSDKNSLTLIEERVDYSYWVKDGFGTSDALVLIGDHLHVIDLKYGKGEPVYAEGNTQGMLYGLGAYHEMQFMTQVNVVTIHIVQPRINNFSSWTITSDDLLLFAEHAKHQSLLAETDDAPFGPGEKSCRWCPLSGQCKAQAEFNLNLISSEFDNLDELDNMDAKKLTPEEIAKVLPYTSMIVKWVKTLEEHALEEILAGNTIPGFKAVHGRSLRIWTKGAEKALRDVLDDSDLYTRKMVTPAQAEKVFKELKIDFSDISDEYIVKPEGKATLVPESDKRQPIKTIAEEF